MTIAEKTEVLLEALPYIKRFQGSVFVVKYGGSFVEDEAARLSVATDLAFLSLVGVRVVLVHGGGKAISREMELANVQPVFREGLRVTDERSVEIVERVLNEVINQEICADLAAQGGHPSSVAGQWVLHCEKLARDEDGHPVDLGFVGSITQVNTRILQSLLDAGQVPVISPIGRDSTGQLFNINADMAAARVAQALQARRLVYLCDVPGLMLDPNDPSTLISTLTRTEADDLIARRIIGTGMLPKVRSALGALEMGVKRVHFIDGRQRHSLLLEIFTDQGVGTEIQAHE